MPFYAYVEVSRHATRRCLCFVYAAPRERDTADVRSVYYYAARERCAAADILRARAA